MLQKILSKVFPSARQEGIVARFHYLDDFCHALDRMRALPEFTDSESFSPTSYHEIEHAAHLKPSPVRFFTLIGALTGTLTGFALPLLCDWDWPIITGGKTPGIYSIPAYVVIGFEFTILFGGIMTVLGILVMGRLPNLKCDIIDESITSDRFVVFVPGVTVESSQAKYLKDWGAQEIFNRA